MDCRAAILAGGRGTRLGRPKATLELAGRPLLAYPLAAAAEAGLETLVVAKRDSELPELEAAVLFEPQRPRHPLCGVLAALRASAPRPILALACDMPFLSADLLAWLASLEEPLVVADGGAGLQPLLARYDPVLIEALEAALPRHAALRELVASLAPRVVGETELARFGDPRLLCFNLNTPEDLSEAEHLLLRR